MPTKRILILSILIFITIGSFAQNADFASIQVIYEFKHMRDTGRRDIYHTEEMGLLVSKTSSFYYSFTGKRQEEKMQAKAAEAEASGSNEIDLGLWRATTNESIYLFKKNRALYKLVNYKGNSYLIKEPFPALSWHIGRETKKIKNHLCQSATTRFGGRKYTAWFTTDIPLGFGPWKLQGLPGLILEAEDGKGEVKFKCISVNENGSFGKIALPANSISTTQSAFDRMKEGMKTTAAGSSNEGAIIIAPKIQGSGNQKKSSFNNPLEKQR